MTTLPQAAPGSAQEKSTSSPETSSPTLAPGDHGSLGSTLVMALGGLLTGIVVGAGLLALPASQGASATLESVTQDQLDEAILSLGGQVASSAVSDAKQCKVPLAYVTVVAEAGTTASTIRIRSGAFLSPQLLLTPSPRRVAIPFPAPYATGKGMLFVEGVAQGLNVWLTPGQHYTQLNGPAAINVVWTPKTPPC